MKRVWDNHKFLWKLCFKTAPGFMLYHLYDAFRYQFFIFLEHVIGIRYVLHCAEYGEPFYKVVLAIGGIMILIMIQMVPDGYFIYGLTPRSKPKLYKALKEQMYEKAAQLDLSCYDNPKYYNEFVLAVAEAETSIDRFLQLLNSAVQSMVSISRNAPSADGGKAGRLTNSLRSPSTVWPAPAAVPEWPRDRKSKISWDGGSPVSYWALLFWQVSSTSSV